MGAPEPGCRDIALQKLSHVMGADRGRAVFVQILGRLERGDIFSPQDLLDFANALIGDGGLHRAVGRTLKVTAVLRGAVE
jgi:hypothetical protein